VSFGSSGVIVGTGVDVAGVRHDFRRYDHVDRYVV
jgi:hypothetical protein